jgi:hypothetical protein
MHLTVNLEQGSLQVNEFIYLLEKLKLNHLTSYFIGSSYGSILFNSFKFRIFNLNWLDECRNTVIL